MKMHLDYARRDSYCTSGGLFWTSSKLAPGDRHWLLGLIFSTGFVAGRGEVPQLRVLSNLPSFRTYVQNNGTRNWPAWWPSWLVRMHPGKNCHKEAWTPVREHGWTIRLDYKWTRKLYHRWWRERWGRTLR